MAGFTRALSQYSTINFPIHEDRSVYLALILTQRERDGSLTPLDQAHRKVDSNLN